TALTAFSGSPRFLEMRPRLLERPTWSRTSRLPGVIRHTGALAKIHCGRLDGRPDAMLEGYVEQMKAAGIDIMATGDMLLEEICFALGHLGDHGEHAPAARCYPRRRGHAYFLLQADARDDGRWSCGRRPFSADFQTELERSVAGFAPMMKASMANDLHAGN